MAVLVVAAHDNKSVRANVANAVAAATKLDSDVTVLVAGKDCGDAAKSAAALQGVTKVLQVEDAAYANWLAEDIAPLVVKLAPNYSHVVMAADSVGKNVAPRVAALLDVGQVSEAIQIVSPDTFVRPIYAGNAMATVQTSDKIKVVTIRPTNFKAVGTGGSAAIEQIGGEGAKGLSSYVGAELSKSERPELTLPRSSCRAAAAWAAATTSRSSRRWPTSSAPESAPAAPRSMPAMCRTTTRSARPARWSRPTFILPSASPARSSISPA